MNQFQLCLDFCLENHLKRGLTILLIKDTIFYYILAVLKELGLCFHTKKFIVSIILVLTEKLLN